MSARLALLALLLILAAATPAPAQLDRLLDVLRGSGTRSVGDAKIGAALKEALQVGTENAVKLTGRTDGYFKNQAIKILMPGELRTLERGLRTVGYGAEVDKLVLGMNRAAERAAPAAKQIFWNAIGEMTIDDAQKILGGGNTAATDYFKDKTTDQLTEAFSPVVERTMNEVGVARQYNQLLGRAKAIPFFRAEDYDLDRYVVGKSLDGLFLVVGQEEQKIRTNPAARVTDLLKDVFGR